MTSVKRIATGLTLSAILSQSALAATTPACITTGEMRAGITFLVPTLIKAVKMKCATVLPGNAYLMTQGEALAARYHAPSSTTSPEFKSLVAKIAGSTELPELPGIKVEDIASAAILGGIQKDLKPAMCPDIDVAMALVDPLPADNMIGLLAFIGTKIVQEDANKKAKAGKTPKFALCPGPVAAK
jgi:hypothetical protein